MYAYCEICVENKTIDNFRSLQCGHCFCSDCIEALRKNAPKCPHCRLKIKGNDGKRIFIQFVCCKVSAAYDVANGIQKMGVDTPVISIEKAGRKIQNVLQDIGAEKDVAALLLKAVEDFQDRIIPHFKEFQLKCRENESLKNRLLDSCKEKETIQGMLNESLLAAETAVQETLRLRDENVRSESEKEELRKDKHSLRSLLDRHIAKARAKKDKITALKLENASLIERIETYSSPSRTSNNFVDLGNTMYATSEWTPTQTNIYTTRYTDRSSAENDEIGNIPSSPSSRLHLPSSPHIRLRETDPRNFHRDFEGLPPPNRFTSDWQFPLVPKKRKLENQAEFVRSNGAIVTDRSGHVKGLVQCGPKRRLRAG